jgi:hypothetical protein
MLTGSQSPIDNLKLPCKAGSRRCAALGAHRSDHSSMGLCDSAGSFRAMAPRRSMSTSASLPTSITTPATAQRHAASRLSLQLHSHRPNLQHAGAHQHAFLGSVPLISGTGDLAHHATDVPVPVVNLRPFSNSLSFDFTFQLAPQTELRRHTPINMQGAILRDSYLDLRGYPHWTPLPNLEIFSNAGFPFTRLADLSETTVVLPPTPTEQEIETFVTLMGHFGRQTGFPGFARHRRRPRRPSERRATPTSSSSAPATTSRLSKNSARIFPSRRQRPDSGPRHAGLLRPLLHNAWWKLRSSEHTESGELTAGRHSRRVIEGIESPYDIAGSRSIVAIHLKDAATFEPFMDTFLNVQQSSDISGSVSVLHGTQFNPSASGRGLSRRRAAVVHAVALWAASIHG